MSNSTQLDSIEHNPTQLDEFFSVQTSTRISSTQPTYLKSQARPNLPGLESTQLGQYSTRRVDPSQSNPNQPALDSTRVNLAHVNSTQPVSLTQTSSARTLSARFEPTQPNSTGPDPTRLGSNSTLNKFSEQCVPANLFNSQVNIFQES